MLAKWNCLSEQLRNESVKEYYDILKKKRIQLTIKRIIDFLLSLVLSILLIPFLIIISILVIIDSGMPVFYLQKRITTNCKEFKIFKFRTMINNADKIGSLVTVDNDSRVTKIGKFLRKFRLDELPQIFNILFGSMSFVGTRPEVEKYVSAYTDEMYATLLLPAGVTSNASLQYKDEAQLLKDSDDADKTYIEEILPKKMQYNLEYIKTFSLLKDAKIIFKTIIEIFK